MPATLPWPKIANTPSNSRCLRPSISSFWALRKRTIAWAAVSRIVFMGLKTFSSMTRARRAQRAQDVRQMGVDQGLDHATAPLETNAGEENRQSNGRKREREGDRVLEYVRREMGEIHCNADRAEHHVDAAVQEQAEGDERDIEGAVQSH